jgi:hypothetical protein
MLTIGLYAQQLQSDVHELPQPGERILGSVERRINNLDWPVVIRNMTITAYETYPNEGQLLLRGMRNTPWDSWGWMTCTALVVTATPDPAIQNPNSSNDSASNPSASGDFHKALEDALDRALADIPSRSRIGLGHITTRDRTIRRALSETIEDILLDHNMRIVDRSEQHVVIEELGEDSELLANFRHADYVLTVRMDDSSIRVRLLNVRNGEVAGMATERF